MGAEAAMPIRSDAPFLAQPPVPGLVRVGAFLSALRVRIASIVIVGVLVQDFQHRAFSRRLVELT